MEVLAAKPAKQKKCIQVSASFLLRENGVYIVFNKISSLGVGADKGIKPEQWAINNNKVTGCW